LLKQIESSVFVGTPVETAQM